MRFRVAAVVWLTLAGPAFGQQPLTVAAALEEATASNPELLQLRRERGLDRQESLLRAGRILAEVRRAHAELAIARELLQLYEGQATITKEMADAAALRYRSTEMVRHDPSEMLIDLGRLALARSNAREQVKVGELRLNAALGRQLDAPVEPLAMREGEAPADAVELALARSVAGPTEAGHVAVRRRVLEARTRVDGARERAAIMTTSVLPQAAVAFDQARAAYTANQGAFAAMLDAHHRQLEVRVESAAVSAAHERALVELDIAIGETPDRLLRAAGGTGEN